MRPEGPAVGVLPVHVGGLMMDIGALRRWAAENRLWVVEDAAHAFPAAWRPSARSPWQRCGEKTAEVSCFSFYANKTITTGEGGMAVTDDQRLAERMRMMSLHGLSQDAWDRYSGGKSWDYRIVAPGYKYNLTDIAAALGLRQLSRAEELRRRREAFALRYREALGDLEEIELPPAGEDRIHAWHLFPIRLRLDRLSIDRNGFLDALRESGVSCSVHWRPLHLHPYYEQTFGWRPEDLPVATAVWERLVSLPLFPGMREEEFDHVVRTVERLCARHRRVPARALGAEQG
jgi:perosamine synthetase